MLDKTSFWKIAHPYLEQQLAKWGFGPEEQGQFMRKHEGYWDGIEIGLLRGDRDFRVHVGIHMPALHHSSNFIGKWDHRTFPITGFMFDYPFVNEWELRERLEQRMLPRLEKEALPWFDRFLTLSDVTEEFYDRRVKPNPMKKLADPVLNPSDAFGWAMYGWLLEELGRHDEAKQWLERAYTEVRRPLFVDKYGGAVAVGTKGARSIRHPESEERLEELLRQSLKRPLP
jgi:hypothetical protein